MDLKKKVKEKAAVHIKEYVFTGQPFNLCTVVFLLDL